jgi:hypothetical protein
MCGKSHSDTGDSTVACSICFVSRMISNSRLVLIGKRTKFKRNSGHGQHAQKKLERPELPIYAYHMKPEFRNQIEEQISRLGIQRVAFLEEGQIITV